MSSKRCMVCSCEKTMALDEKKLSKAMGEIIGNIHISLCRAQLASFESALEADEELTIACTQEAPLFLEIADELNADSRLNFVNIRENAGWSQEGGKATPKIAALLKNTAFEANPTRLKSITSDGMCLVYGSGEQALEAANLLNDNLSVTLLLSDEEEFVLPVSADIPIYRGNIVKAQGSFGAFSLTVDDYAPLRPASRDGLEFAVTRNGAETECSLILDLSGNTPLFSGHSHRDGYASVDPGDPASVLRAVIRFSDLVGEFEKPIYVDYNSDTCAHGRSQKTGCSKCLDVCPAGAIADAGDIIEIDNGICGGCGSCHAVCPTGSIHYQYPSQADILARTQHLLSAYADAGGKNPVLLLHNTQQGMEMIAAIARFGRGLPANVLPLDFHATTVLGHTELLGMVASGAARTLVLADPAREDELAGLQSESDLANAILSALGLDKEPRIKVICEPDPEKVEDELWKETGLKPLKATTFQAVGNKREIARIVLSNLHGKSRAKPDIIALPEHAPYGRVAIDTEACTLCMACTSACPANAITDTPGEPKLRFTEAACVQCGLCVATCPEKALALVPQLDFTPAAMQPETLHEEEPFDCISCGTPFATKSTIERITAQLAGKHAMFASEERANLIKMCENCRVEAQANSSEDPFTVGKRPKPRTTEDYLAAEKGELSADDFLMDD